MTYITRRSVVTANKAVRSSSFLNSSGDCISLSSFHGSLI